MKTEISALENLQADFYWVSSLLDWAVELVTKLSPLIALGGVIWLFYAQRRADAQRVDIAERKKLYRDFISQIETCTAVWQRHKNLNRHMQLAVQQLSSLHEEIQLIASNEPIDASDGVIVALNDLYLSDEILIISTDGNQRTLWDNVTFARRNATKLFREDLDK